MTTRPEQWLEAHKEYEHEGWCLIWPFTRNPELGRGQVNIGGKTRWAHRVMCQSVKGPPPTAKHQAGHICGNGHLGCVNPKHLAWMTNSENQKQRYAQGRVHHTPRGSERLLTDAQVEDIQQMYGYFTQQELANKYECSVVTIRRALARTQ